MSDRPVTCTYCHTLNQVPEGRPLALVTCVMCLKPLGQPEPTATTQQGTSPAPPNKTTSKRKSHKGIIITIAFLVIAAVTASILLANGVFGSPPAPDPWPPAKTHPCAASLATSDAKACSYANNIAKAYLKNQHAAGKSVTLKKITDPRNKKKYTVSCMPAEITKCTSKQNKIVVYLR